MIKVSGSIFSFLNEWSVQAYIDKCSQTLFFKHARAPLLCGFVSRAVRHVRHTRRPPHSLASCIPSASTAGFFTKRTRRPTLDQALGAPPIASRLQIPTRTPSSSLRLASHRCLELLLLGALVNPLPHRSVVPGTGRVTGVRGVRVFGQSLVKRVAGLAGLSSTCLSSNPSSPRLEGTIPPLQETIVLQKLKYMRPPVHVSEGNVITCHGEHQLHSPCSQTSHPTNFSPGRDHDKVVFPVDVGLLLLGDRVLRWSFFWLRRF